MSQPIMLPLGVDEADFLRDRLRQLARYTTGSETAARLESIARRIDGVLPASDDVATAEQARVTE
jgi:hypothetical protein